MYSPKTMAVTALGACLFALPPIARADVIETSASGFRWVAGSPPADAARPEPASEPAYTQAIEAAGPDAWSGRVKALVSGGAALHYDVALFFAALGVPLFQGYGLTECAPVISVNGPGATKLHTVGRPIPGMDVKIAEDGEILARGGSVMRGYWRDETGTSQVLRDGWLHTGDIGVIDPDGFLQIR